MHGMLERERERIKCVFHAFSTHRQATTMTSSDQMLLGMVTRMMDEKKQFEQQRTFFQSKERELQADLQRVREEKNVLQTQNQLLIKQLTEFFANQPQRMNALHQQQFQAGDQQYQRAVCQFARSQCGITNAIMGALDAHTSMSAQALNSDKVRKGMKDILINKAGLYETLREQVASE